jgi:hypothetical protein
MTLPLAPDATVLDALLAALDNAARFNSQVEAPPLALLWPDKARDWAPVVGEVRRLRLAGLKGLDAVAAGTEIAALEAEHGPRRSSVWADLGQTPLAISLRHLHRLALGAQKPLAGSTLDKIVTDYQERGWQVDDAVLDALAAVSSQADRAAVAEAIGVVYAGWLRASATNFQTAYTGATDTPPPAIPAGTCLLFVDGLRYDLGKRLEARLNEHGCTIELMAALSAVPSVTPTAKPACSPVADLFVGGAEFGTRIAETGAALTQAGFEKLLEQRGFVVLAKHETAPPGPEARGWTEFGEFDKLGHDFGSALAAQVDEQIARLAERVVALLDGGWSRVQVFTDHGWLLLPGGLPKVLLQEHLTVARKGRCARLKPTSETPMQTLPWRWDPEVRIAVAPHNSCFVEGKVYEHGGLSAQECVTPRLVVSRANAPVPAAAIADVTWNGLRCTIRLTGATAGLRADLRWKAAEAIAPNDRIAEVVALDADQQRVRLVVEDTGHEGRAAIVVLVDASDQVVAQRLTTIGGEE